MAQSINNLAVNSLIKFGSIYGTPIIWKIADKNHPGYPSNSVTLWTNNVIKIMCFDEAETTSSSESYRRTYGNNNYRVSNIRQWLNSDAEAGKWFTKQHSYDRAPDNTDTGNRYAHQAGFLNGFTADEKAAMLDTTVLNVQHSMDAGGDSSSRAETVNKVFLPSLTEIGFSGEEICGSKLACVNGYATVMTNTTPEARANANYADAKYGSTAGSNYCSYWTRDAKKSSSTGVYYVTLSGGFDAMHANEAAIGMRCLCNLSADLAVSDSIDGDGCYTVIHNTAPTAPASLTLPTEITGGKNAEISWGAATDADGNLSGYVLEQLVDSGVWEQIYKGSARSYSAPIEYGSQTVQFRVKAYDAVGAESTYTTSAVRIVTNNRDPVISGKDGDLGNFSAIGPIHDYNVTDEDGHTVNVVEKLDGTTIKSYTATLGQINSLTIDDATWRKVLNGSHTLTITATDAMGASVTRTMTFTKTVTSVEFEQTIAMAADDMPTKALVNIQGYFPAGCTLTVLICNNGNDASPTWEDITSQARSGQKFYFANKTKTASTWGVKLKVSLLKGSATEACYIQSLGGNFA